MPIPEYKIDIMRSRAIEIQRNLQNVYAEMNQLLTTAKEANSLAGGFTIPLTILKLENALYDVNRARIELDVFRGE
jgi:hypothetical protein